jgi:hypothetical protein
MFQFVLRNLPESMMKGHIATQGKIEYYYFKASGAVALLFIEMKLQVGDSGERLNAIAQVIAECDGQSLFRW